MVLDAVDRGWSVGATAERFQVDPKTVRKWRNRFLAEGEEGLEDRSSRPHRSANRISRRVRCRVLELCRKRCWGVDHIGFMVGLAPSTVQNILTRAGLGRPDRGNRAPRAPVKRYQRDTLGELIHVDIKKLVGIPDGGGWRIRHRGYPNERAKSRMVGYRYIHTAIDDRTRNVYSEIHTDEKTTTEAGSWTRTPAWYQSIGITPRRVITDNGSCYKSALWHQAYTATGTTLKKARPRRPQTNGKIERFHRILLEERAYIRPWWSETEHTEVYARVPPLLQSPPTPRIPRIGNPNQHPQGQPLRRTR